MKPDTPGLWSLGITSQLGAFTLWASTLGLVRLESSKNNDYANPPEKVRQLLGDAEIQLGEYLLGRRRDFNVVLDWRGATEFNKRVWAAPAGFLLGR
jgi:O6-methylguanine-DNA--protein-cysteine methyltransferase